MVHFKGLATSTAWRGSLRSIRGSIRSSMLNSQSDFLNRPLETTIPQDTRLSL
jgi:hypothetical protein